NLKEKSAMSEKIPRSPSSNEIDPNGKRVRPSQTFPSLTVVEEDEFAPNSSANTRSVSNPPASSNQSNTALDNDQNQENDDSNTEDPNSDEWESVDEDVPGKKIKSKCWQYFKRKFKVNKKTKEKKMFVTCNFQTPTGECKKTISHFSGSTGAMVDHLRTKHKFECSKTNSQNEISYDEKCYFLLMFIITASLPFRCVEKSYFKKFCKSLNPELKIPSRKVIANMSDEHFLKKKNILVKMLEKVSFFNFTTDCWTSVQNFSYLTLTAHYFTDQLSLRSICLAVRHVLGGHSSNNLTEYIKEILNEFKIVEKIGFFTTDNVNAMGKTVKQIGKERIPCFAHILHLIIKNTLKSIKDHSKNSELSYDPEQEYDQIGEQVEEENEFDQQFDQLAKISIKEKLKLDVRSTLISYSDNFKLIDKIIRKCCSIASLFNHSTNFKEELTKKQKENNKKVEAISQNVETRWNSLFQMLKRISDNHAILNLILSNERKHKHLVISDDEKKCLEESIEIFEVFYEITQRISTESIGTSSLIIPSILLLKSITKENNTQSLFQMGFKEILAHYIKYYEEKYDLTKNKILVLSTFLNPKFKKFSKAPKDDSKQYIEISKNMIRLKLPEIKSLLNLSNPEQSQNLSERICNKKAQLSDSSDEEIEDEISWRLAKKEIGAYIEDSLVLFEKEFEKIKENSNDLKSKSKISEYWKFNRVKFPILFEFFKMYGNIQGSSTPSERVFSHVGYQIWDRRNKISPNRVEKIMFLYENENYIPETI
ncbi:unnamed protein product, partial [Brachionus calyciflorus]